MNLTVNRKSWHYQLADFGGLYARNGQTNICTYFWRMSLGVLLCLMLFTAATAAALLVFIPMVGVVAWFVSGVFLWEWPGFVIGYIGILFAAVFSAVEYGPMAVRKISDAAARQEDRSPVAKLAAAGYRSWKDKTCVLINVLDQPEGE